MRRELFILLVLLSSSLFRGQESSSQLKLDGLRIPVELVKTIKTGKVHPGDPVQFRMAEPILAGARLVLPRNANLYGRILRATSVEGENRSQLSIVVERVEWKDHVLPLHAFVAGFLLRKSPDTVGIACVSRASVPQFGDRNNMFARNSPLKAMFDDCDDTDQGQYDPAQQADLHMLSGIVIYRTVHKDGSVLVSKKNIHLNSGTLIMLENRN